MNVGLRRRMSSFLFLVGLGWGCTDATPSDLVLGGQVDVDEMKASVGSFKEFRSAQEGDALVLTGNIGKVCPAGCWFYLEGETDLTYVDVLGDFEVPQTASGKKSWVRGMVSGEGGARILQAVRVVVERPN